MRLFTSTLILLFSANIAGAIAINNFDASTNDRFADDASFIGSSYSFSGVGLSSGGRWATLISSNVVISASHYAPSESITFYATNDKTGESFTTTISATTYNIEGTDIWLAVLDQAVPEGYTVYSIATESITNSTDFVNSSIYNSTAYMLGHDTLGDSTQYVGTNILDAWISSVTVSGTTNSALMARNNTSDLTLTYGTGPGSYSVTYDTTTYEAYVEGGDSGSPLLVDTGDGTLTLVGIGWFNGTIGEGDVDDTTTSVSGYTYVGNYTTEIENFITLHAVPEPHTYALMMGVCAMLTRLMRRRLKRSPESLSGPASR